jgi:hypothetical protein
MSKVILLFSSPSIGMVFRVFVVPINSPFAYIAIGVAAGTIAVLFVL